MFRSLLLTLLLIAPAAPAVVILDSTWAEEGGHDDDPSAGFGAAIELAYRPAFRATVALSADGGDTWGDCTGTWIGNDARHGYVLTAAHCFEDEESSLDPQDVLVRSTGGRVYRVVNSAIHEDYVDTELTTGEDLAILWLHRPVNDAGPPPLLYGGDDEYGRLLTFVGYGARGVASNGEHEDYHDGGDERAAAQGVIEVVKDEADDEDSGNYLGVFLPAEDGSIENPHDGEVYPANRLVGLLGSGDSGGPAWMRIDGRWVVAGVNSNGTGNAEAGETSWFVRVSGQREWIEFHAPVARFFQ
jgi:hypothetical protein